MPYLFDNKFSGNRLPGGFNPSPISFGAYRPEMGFGAPVATRSFDPGQMLKEQFTGGSRFEAGPSVQPGVQPPRAGGFGGALKDAMGWLTDKDQGLARQLLLSTLIGGAADIYGSYKQGKREDEERRRERRSAEGVAPIYGRILKDLL